MMRKLLSVALLWLVALSAGAQQKLTVTYVAKNAVRVRYAEPKTKSTLPDWLYVKHDELKKADIVATVKGNVLTVKDKAGKNVFCATAHQLKEGEATLTFDSPKDEFLLVLDSSRMDTVMCEAFRVDSLR